MSTDVLLIALGNVNTVFSHVTFYYLDRTSDEFI